MRRWAQAFTVGICALSQTLFAQTPANRAPMARAPNQAPRLVPPPGGRLVVEPLPSVHQTVRQATFVQPAPTVSEQLPGPLPAPPEEIPADRMSEPNSFPIDLPTALRLADANNLLVAFARE